MSPALALIASCLLAAPASGGGGDVPPRRSEDEAGRALLDRASELVDLTGPGAKPFRLKADVTVWGEFKGQREGTIDVTWRGADDWREEIVLPDYREVRVARGETMSILRAPECPPERSEWPLRRMHAIVHRPGPERGAAAGKPRDRGKEGSCVPLVDLEGDRTVHCVAASGVVSRIETSGTHTHVAEDPAPFGEKPIPRTYRLLDGRSPAYEIRVTSLEPLGAAEAPPSEPVGAPAGARAWPHCADFEPAVVRAAALTYPPLAAKAKRTGLVIIEGVIDVDGRIADARVACPSNFEALDTQTLKAAQRWRFVPATCAGQPVPSELRWEVDYRVYWR